MSKKTVDNQEQKIVEVAQNLFIEQGFEKTSMSKIAEEAGISRTALHYYFRTKEKMFQAVFGSIIESFLPKVQAIFDKDMPLLEKLSRVLDEYIATFKANPHLPRFIMGEIQRDVNHLITAGRVLKLDSYLNSIEQVIIHEMEQGNIKQIPMPTVLLTVLSQITFPFLAKNLVMVLFYENEESFEMFLIEWKQNIIRQMESLLLNKNPKNNKAVQMEKIVPDENFA